MARKYDGVVNCRQSAYLAVVIDLEISWYSLIPNL
jgi:hypothetical protein